MKNVEIIVPKIKMKSLISYNGFRAWIAGVTGDRIVIHNASQWFTDSETDLYVKNLVKLVKWDKEEKLSEAEKTGEEFLMFTNRFGDKNLTIDKARNLNLYRWIAQKLGDKKYQGVSAVGTFKDKLILKESLFEELPFSNNAELCFKLSDL